MTDQVLKDKVAIITGASRGIGKALAIRLAEEGADIVVAAKSEHDRERLPGTIHDTAEEVRQRGRRALAVKVDVREESEIQAMVVSLEIKENIGPVIEYPITSMRDVEALQPLQTEERLPHVMETIKMLVNELDVPLIGFAGGPFTLASYLVEGKPTRDFRLVKSLMYSAPDVWAALMERLSTMVAGYLVDQIRAGCQVVQVFDSWVGNLNLLDYEQYVKPYMHRIVEAVRATGAPMIHFGVQTGHLLPTMASIGGDVMGVDWKEQIDLAWERIGPNHGVQGNLDPIALFAPPDILESKVMEIMRRVGGRPGHIFNLGHGVLPPTPVSALQRVTEIVHNYRA